MIQGHIHTVPYSFRHVGPWVSMLLILSGEVSINPGPNTNLLTKSLIYIRSLKTKSIDFADFINSNKSDFIAVTELYCNSFNASVTPLGYQCIHVPHSEGRGGGVGFFICVNIDFKVIPQPDVNTFGIIDKSALCQIGPRQIGPQNKITWSNRPPIK